MGYSVLQWEKPLFKYFIWGGGVFVGILMAIRHMLKTPAPDLLQLSVFLPRVEVSQTI